MGIVQVLTSVSIKRPPFTAKNQPLWHLQSYVLRLLGRLLQNSYSTAFLTSPNFDESMIMVSKHETSR